MLGIVIAESDDSMRRRLVQALVVERGVHVVGTAPDPVEALDLVYRTQPDLVLVDLGMPQSGGLVLIRAIRLTRPGTVVVIRQAGSDELTVHEAFRAGAGGFLIEEGLDDRITSCIRLVTPAQVQQFVPAVPSRHTPTCSDPRGTREPRCIGRGTTRLLRCTASHRDRDDRRRSPCHTGDLQAHHARRHS